MVGGSHISSAAGAEVGLKGGVIQPVSRRGGGAMEVVTAQQWGFEGFVLQQACWRVRGWA